LNEKDKEISVLKDNYEKIIKDLRSNLSKAKMESAIKIFELQSEIKGKNIEIIFLHIYNWNKHFI